MSEEIRFVFTTEKVKEIEDKANLGYKIPRHEKYWLDNNKGVRRSSLVFNFSDDEMLEYAKCKLGEDIEGMPYMDPETQVLKRTGIKYFSETYCRIKNEVGETNNIKLRDYQEDMLDLYTYNRFSIICAARQCGKTITAAITLLYYSIFNNKKNVLIAGNIQKTADEIITKIKDIYYELPFFIKPGAITWNKSQITFGDTNCVIKSTATTKTAAIGNTIDFLYLDEFAHVPANIAGDFYRSIFPTVSAMQNSKIAITSTPNGYNLFWKILNGSEEKKNKYKSMRVYWHQVPGRFNTYLRFGEGILKKYKMSIEDVFSWVKEMGFEEEQKDGRGIVVRQGLKIKLSETEKGMVEEIHVPNSDEYIPKNILNIIKDQEWENPLSDYFRGQILKKGDSEIKFNDKDICEVSSWREDAISNIGSIEAFNQEYDLQFLSGAKMVLDSATMNKISNQIHNFKYHSYKPLEDNLFRSYEDELLWIDNPDIFNPSDIKKYHFAVSIDISEGLGGDYSVINIFRVMVKDLDTVPDKIKSIYDFFYLEQVGIFRCNTVSVEELGEIAYVLFFEVMNPINISVVVESNNWGNELVKTMKEMYKGYNEYGGYIWCKYKHRQDAKHKSIGIKLRQNKNLFVKEYQKRVKRGDICIHHQDTMREMTKFIKKPSASGGVKFEADSGSNDDIVMTIVELSSVFENSKYHNMIMYMMESLHKKITDKINRIMDGCNNMNTVDYSILNSALKNADRMRNNNYNKKDIDMFGKYK